MEEEGTLQVTRRTTRSLASNSNVDPPKLSITHKPTINDLIIYGDKDKPFTLDDLFTCFPGRNDQISDILSHVGPLNSPMLPLFVYGGSSMGKTSIVLNVFKYLRRPFVYTSCVTCYSPRILFESILNQLLFHVKSEGNGYASAKKCEKPSDFVNYLRECLVNVLDCLKRDGEKLGSKKKVKVDDKGCVVYLVIDNLEVVRDWDKCSTILPLLFGLFRTLGLPEVGIIFLSKASPDTYYANSGYIEPVSVYFPGYTEKELRQILLRKQVNQELYSSFLDVVLKSFLRVTRRVDELSAAIAPLYVKYCQALDDPSSGFTEMSKQKKEETKRRLYGNIASHIGPSLNEIFRISSPGAELNDPSVKMKASSKKMGSLDGELDFHMSTSAKYLLLSAFLASRNPATLDASLFDSTGGLDSRKKKRKCSEKTLEQKEAVEQELILKGPGTFPLERLLAIFQCLTSMEDTCVADNLPEDDLLGDEFGQSELNSDVLLQLSSLCNANLISKGGSCPLEGSTRYKSTVSEELAMKIARSLKFPLSRYLYRR